MVARKCRHSVVAVLVLYLAVFRPRLLRWGASSQEGRDPLRGDELVDARRQTTRGVSIAARREEVWPWLVQMGYGRGGWYSYDWIERQAGAGDFAEGGSAKRVIPELQGLAVGDTVALSPSGGLTVAVLDPPNALVLHYRMNALSATAARDGDRFVLDWTWAFVLNPADEHSCRLLARVRAEYRPRWLFALMPLVLEPIHFTMERKMLRTIKRQVGSPQHE
jgi:hypothetical protein